MNKKKNSNIKLIQVFHKNFPRIKSPIVTSMHVGKAIANKDVQESLKDMIGDDSIQDNISSQNDIYCELTAQYFAWKNLNLLSNLNYIGFMHYRRVFNFSNRTKNVKNKDYSIQNVDKSIKNQDVILIEKMPCYSKIAMSQVEDVKTHWELEHNIKDLDIVYNRVVTLYPEYKKSFDIVLKSPSIHWYNMFIMRTDLFKKYSEWLFSILDIDINSFVEKPRIKGFFAEILLNVFIEKNKNNLKIKEVPSLKIEEPKTLKNTFIENIFSIKNQSSKLHKKYIVFTILGLKIKFQNPKNKILSFNTVQDGKLIKADSLMLAYNKQINERQFLECTENILKLIQKDDLTQDELLIYLDTLVTNNEYLKAEKILEEYVKKYKFSGIWSFYRLANFAKSLGYDNDLNNRAVGIYADILSDDVENKFKSLIANKSIAIVGNGPSELYTNHGKDIDSHDIVIRMNNYRIDGYENDYGSRCDIWARGIGASDILDNTKDKNYKACLYAADISKFKVSYKLLRILERDIKNNNLISLAINNIVGTQIKKETGIYFPTTGFNTILYLLKNCTPEIVHCYGFTFNQKNIDGYATHYFNDRSKKEAIKRSSVHSFDDEGSYLKKIFKDEVSCIVK